MNAQQRAAMARVKQANFSNQWKPQDVYALIKRVTKSAAYAEHFILVPIHADAAFDRYRIYAQGDQTVIEANTGIAACVAFNRYLRQVCHCFYGPLTQNINLPANPPQVAAPLEAKTPFLYRYFLNYCTFSYTYLFAGWKEWEQLTDYMLLSGVNLYLNIVGHELVWHDTLASMGYSKDEINRYLCGPAYLPWQWMGNMTGFGGNLSDAWYAKQKKLSNRINQKMRAFGAEPMLPGYYGMVPADFQEKFPQSNPIDQGIWCEIQRPALIAPSDAMFDQMADTFYAQTKRHFGACKFFSGDPFHEGGNAEGVDLAAFGQGVVAKMRAHAPTGVWFLQGWQTNPKRELLKALDPAEVLVGNLSADLHYDAGDDYCGYPWLYLTTPNFGGTRKMSGNLSGLLSEPLDLLDRPEKNAMVGIGMTMEAVELDEILYDLFGRISFADQRISKEAYLTEFLEARYGYANQNLLTAYTLLADHMYTKQGSNLFGSKESGLCPRPDLKTQNVSTWGTTGEIIYPKEMLLKVIDLLLAEYEMLQNNPCYRLDLMDITRQAVADFGWEEIRALDTAYEAKDKEAFLHHKEVYLGLFAPQEALMSTNSLTRLDRWVNRAKQYGTTKEEQNQFAFHAKNLLTLWAPKEQAGELRDYAHREWAGMILPFYKRRWEAYLNTLLLYFDERENLPQIDWKEFEYVFMMSDEAYPAKQTKDLKAAVCTALRAIGQ